MLAIWSRAGQSPGTCRCISCISNAAAVARRGRHQGFRGSWALATLTPTSTFLYTTVFAAGLTIDAQAKAARNRQWEDAFTHLREALDRPLLKERATESSSAEKEAALEQANHRHGQHGMPLEQLPKGLDWDMIHRVVGMDIADDGLPLAHFDNYAQTAWDDLRFDSRLPGAQSLEWPANTGRHLMRYNLPPQSLWAVDSMRLTAMRRRHSWKKLAIQEMSTGLLLHTLITHANLPRFFPSASSHLEHLSPQLREVAFLSKGEALQARKHILKDIETLHQTPVNASAGDILKVRLHMHQSAIPSYFQDADGDFYDICQQMNDGIKQLFRQTSKGNDRKEAIAVAKICHNLLVSTASPDLQTFNILFSGFKRWQRPNLVDAAIAAFYAHKLRPNEITCREILGHYISESRPDAFSRFVAKMRGVGDALMLADPKITVNEASQDRLVRVSHDKVYQKVYPSPMVFGALIGGVMKFAGFDRALDIYYEMKADGWGLDVQGLTRLLGDCIRRADWEGGTYLWQEISSIKAKANPRDMAKAYYHMLSLCSVTGNTVAFNQVLNEVAKRGFDRKVIIDAATKTTLWAKKKREYLAPAWAADNVLIAVSDYINDAKPLESEAKLGPGVGDGSGFPGHLPEAESFLEGRRDAWVSWVEYEFGEKPKDPEP
ncbi:hypothetical protein BKA66DRAFT_416157 [Pyrenochaeta sp. MPI-SDFR-AT-0127]|nr:hypothetical protein BKA66DRAFT_416157 [Pyrenochaeta sp. MPI-SDFR-AT-0127]